MKITYIKILKKSEYDTWYKAELCLCDDVDQDIPIISGLGETGDEAYIACVRKARAWGYTNFVRVEE